MNSNYLLGIFGAILVIIAGVFLLGRDGTEDTSITLTTPEETVEKTLPINNDDTNTGTTSEEAVLESDADDGADTNAESLDNGEDESAEADSKPDTAIIIYTDQGFSPKTITISAGDTVTWNNNSSRNMWVASAVHPTHNEYPEESDTDCGGSTFDACIGVGVGQTWSFVFNEIGTWDYHDHLNSSRTGTIEVE